MLYEFSGIAKSDPTRHLTLFMGLRFTSTKAMHHRFCACHPCVPDKCSLLITVIAAAVLIVIV